MCYYFSSSPYGVLFSYEEAIKTKKKEEGLVTPIVGMVDMAAEQRAVEFLSKQLDEKTRENERLRQLVESLNEKCERLHHQLAEYEKREEGRLCACISMCFSTALVTIAIDYQCNECMNTLKGSDSLV